MSDTLSGYRRRGLRMSDVKPAVSGIITTIRDGGAIMVFAIVVIAGAVWGYANLLSKLDTVVTAEVGTQHQVDAIQQDRAATHGRERLDMLDAHQALLDSEIKDIQTQQSVALSGISNQLHEVVAGNVTFATDQASIKAQLADLITQFYATSGNGRKNR